MKVLNREKFMKKYAEEHKYCPKCGSQNYSTTLVGIPFNSDHPEEYKDTNRCKCQSCGWSGSRHDLVSENLYEQSTIKSEETSK